MNRKRTKPPLSPAERERLLRETLDLSMKLMTPPRAAAMLRRASKGAGK